MSEFLELKSIDDHKFSAYLSQPIDKPIGGLVILQEIFGVNTHIQEITNFFSDKGYLTIAPSLFDRSERNVALGYDEDSISKGRNLKSLCDKNALKDIDAAISLVSSAGKVGVIGYCWGGSLSWRIACKNTNLSAAVCYYGGDIPNLKELKPKCNVMTHFGELDQGIPIANVRIFKEANPEVLTYTYPADHGFNCNHRRQYNEVSSKVALDRTLKFLKKNLS
ncbi:dienelactone hydrolase family protein [Alphaproteobacteria bacterium]|nr:dienelactone hydrolase family protein [Alphaproteobacteria bacterium]